MLKKSSEKCEIWEVKQLPVAQCSRVFHLCPANLGTGRVESLTSFSEYLATEHGVLSRTFIAEVVLPELGDDYVRAYYNTFLDDHNRIIGHHFNTMLLRISNRMNGIGEMASNWVHALERLTMRKDLRFLTMLSWADVLPWRGLMRQVRACCSDCYEDMKTEGERVYDPLIWSLSVIKGCCKHRKALRLRCPYFDCNRPLFAISPSSPTGFCQHCKRWLGTTPGQVENPIHLTEQEWADQELTNQWIEQMIEAMPNLERPPTTSNIVQFLTGYIDGPMRGEIAATARHLEMPVTTLHAWLKGTHPDLNSLIRICKICEVSLIDLLTGKHRIPSSVVSTSVQESRKLVIHAAPTWEEQRAILTAVVETNEEPPWSFRELARQMKVLRPTLKNRFPDLVSTIMKRYSEYHSISRFKSRLEAIVTANELPAPSLKAVARRLGTYVENLLQHFPDLCDTISTRFQEAQLERQAKMLQVLQAHVDSNETPLPSLSEIAQQLKCSRTTLRKLAPDLCKAIVENTKRYRATQKAKKIAHKRRRVKQVTRDLHNRGEYPGSSRVAKLIGQGWFRHPNVSEAWREEMRALGYRISHTRQRSRVEQTTIFPA